VTAAAAWGTLAGMADLIEDARALALAAHGDQRYGAHPYITHLDAVVAMLKRHGYADAETLAAGYLHDVLEDTEVEPQDLEARFGVSVLRAVAFCSDAPGPDRKTRKAATYARMHLDVQAGEAWVTRAVRVKVADRCANVAACVADASPKLSMYVQEQATFRAALGQPGLCDGLWETLEALLR
jgi:guanosine-3',5'-bis(diphosphate) 3'-pyrophosphohydrolase